MASLARRTGSERSGFFVTEATIWQSPRVFGETLRAGSKFSKRQSSSFPSHHRSLLDGTTAPSTQKTIITVSSIVHATAHPRARDALVAARLASPQPPPTLSSYLSPPAVDRAVRSPARDVGRDVGPRPTARATRSFVSTSTSARLLSSTPSLVSSLARVTDRASRGGRPRGLARARRRRIHPIDSTGDAREGRRRPIHETTAGRIKNTPVASIDPNARSPRPHRSTRRLSSSSCARARSRRCHARASNTYRDGAKPLTAPNCARATPVAARRAVVAALAETTTRDGAAIVVIITATREGSREDVPSRDRRRARDRVSIDRWMDGRKTTRTTTCGRARGFYIESAGHDSWARGGGGGGAEVSRVTTRDG